MSSAIVSTLHAVRARPMQAGATVPSSRRGPTRVKGGGRRRGVLVLALGVAGFRGGLGLLGRVELRVAGYGVGVLDRFSRCRGHVDPYPVASGETTARGRSGTSRVTQVQEIRECAIEVERHQPATESNLLQW